MHKKKTFTLILIVFACFGALVLALPLIHSLPLKSKHEKRAEYFQKGQTYLDTGKYPEAIIALKNAIQVDPEFAEAYHLLGQSHLKMDDVQEALYNFDQSLRANPVFIPALRALVDIYTSAGKPEKALALCADQIKRAPQNGTIHEIYGTLLLSQGQIDQAETILEKAASLTPLRAQSYFHLGMMCEKQGKQDEAQEYYEKALALSPGFALAANNLAWLYAQKEKDLDRAWMLAEEARKSLPDNANVLHTLGWICYKKQNYYKAVGLLETCVKKNAHHPTFHHHLGMAYSQIGNTDAARRALEKSLYIDPEHPDADKSRLMLAELKGIEQRSNP